MEHLGYERLAIHLKGALPLCLEDVFGPTVEVAAVSC